MEAYKKAVIPHAALVTPNALEAGRLAGLSVRSLADARVAAARIADLGAAAELAELPLEEEEVRATGLALEVAALHEHRGQGRVIEVHEVMRDPRPISSGTLIAFNSSSHSVSPVVRYSSAAAQ